MMLYADSSLLVKIYIDEPGSASVIELLAQATTIGTALVTRAEVAAALAKATRLGALSRSDVEPSLTRFREHWSNFLRLNVSETIVAQADELAWARGLRGYDALHLASALSWQAALDERLTLGTYDRQLWQAGREAGLAVWPAEL
jgi:predicted nucleic acid-binding protein